MKQLYICDRCGAQYTDWDEAYACENGHVAAFTSTMDEETRKRFQYKPGQQMPERVVMETTNWDTPDGEPSYSFFVYKLVGPVPEQESAEIKAEYAERKIREDAWWAEHRQKWKREQEAKAEKESAETAETTA